MIGETFNPKAKRWSFDPRCLELAEYFLSVRASQRIRYEMAQAIQDAVETYAEDESEALAAEITRKPQ